METFIKQNFVVAKFRKMTNRVLRYANANDLQEYRLVRGKLRLVKSYASVEEVRRKSFKCIILTPENYVRGSVVSDESLLQQDLDESLLEYPLSDVSNTHTPPTSARLAARMR